MVTLIKVPINYIDRNLVRRAALMKQGNGRAKMNGILPTSVSGIKKCQFRYRARFKADMIQ